MSERPQVLVADDEPNLRRVLSAQLRRDGYDVHAVADGREALTVLGEHHVDVVISDLRMPELDGMGLLRETAAHHPDVPVILITAHGTIDTAVEALKLGAFDFVTKPFDRDELQAVVRKAARLRRLDESHASPAVAAPAEVGRFGIIGTSEGMHSVYGLIERVA
ncbi:MAG: response regulator, partial [Myxococcota bacterium]